MEKLLHYCLCSPPELCYSPYTIIFHSLGAEFPCTEGTLMHIFLSYSERQKLNVFEIKNV